VINETFGKVMRDSGYRGEFRGVYPVKVNQQEHVIEEIVNFGRGYHHGLEVGSKAELIAAMAYMQDPEAFLICNGYKDEEFLRLALFAHKMGLKVFIVIEMNSELNLIMEQSRLLNVMPNIGVRVKLSSRAGGHWTESGGDRSVFGLTTSEIIDLVDKLKQYKMLHCLKMLHYHVGSQVPNIRNIRAAIQEACRFYVDLVEEGAPMGILDVGGGLAVDYDGSHTNFPSSANYTIEEYCADIIEVVMAMTDEAHIPHPMLVSESGRATVAYHSVLLLNILDTSRVEARSIPESLPDGTPECLVNLIGLMKTLSSKNPQESYHDAAYYRDEVRSLFMHGDISLRDRALAEEIFWNIVSRIARDLREQKYVPDELENLESAIADVYYGNFSVFQSLPDAWAIDQLFPVMPIHRLNERPTREATVSDITCDCDGKIDKFIDLHDVKKTIQLHELKGDDYYLGVFLVGAYQETLGDLHNLLGDTNVVGIHITDAGQIEFTREIEGDSVADVLSYVEYDPKELANRLRKTAEEAVRAGRITPEERRVIMEGYEAGLGGYTYFEQ
jgi:arginine decarboxylase